MAFFGPIRDMVHDVMSARRLRRFQKDLQAAFDAGTEGRYVQTEIRLAALLDRAERELEPAGVGSDVLMKVAAESIAAMALEIVEHGEPTRFGVAVMLLKLSELYRSRRRPELRGPLAVSAANTSDEGGVQICERVVKLMTEILGPQHPHVAAAQETYAVTLRRLGRPTQRFTTSQVTEPALGNLEQCHASGVKAYTQGRYPEAERWFQTAFKEAERSEASALQRADILNNLAIVYRTQGRHELAEPLYRQALGIVEHTLGRQHPAAAAILNDLALLHWRWQGRYAEAEPLLKEALSIQEGTLGASHPEVATSLNNLAGFYATQGLYDQAEPLLKRSLAIREEVLGPDHEAVGGTLHDLAMLYANKEQEAMAERLLERALHVKENALGRDHPHVVDILESYATLLRRTGRPAEAARIESRVIAIRAKRMAETSKQ
jgi:tetratricopeptide (TPR) repeat protein